jgi:hypothetical protein
MEYASEYAAQGASMGSTILSLVFYIISVVAMWKMFEKAGEAGWKSIIPIYNLYVLFKIAWGKGWMFLLLLIPVVNIVIAIMFDIKLAKSYGGGIGMILLCIFLPTISYLILGFGSAEYIGPQ